MNALLDWLASHEAIISAVVGTSSLLVLGLGLVKIIIQGAASPLQHTSPNSPEGVAPLDGGAQAALKRLITPILNLGIQNHFGLEDKIAARTVNVATVCMMSIAAAFIVYGFANPTGRPLVVLHVLSFPVCLLILYFQLTGRIGAARLLLLAVVMFAWAGAQFLVGPWRGNEYVLPVLVVLPILIFKPGETRKRLIALATIGLFASSTIAAGIFADISHIEMPLGMYLFGYYLLLVITVLSMFALLNYYVNFSVASFSEMEIEQIRTDELVKSLFPEEVIRHMNADNQSVAESHEEATVIFITVGGFKSLYRKISAVQLVELLSEIFVKFDELVVSCDIEKINTLGTHYVGATGVFNRGSVDHGAVARFALGALQAMEEISKRLNHRFTLRAGISTGQVISGVIGSAHPCFDIWGETVELANSMHDTAMDNSIVVNESAFWRLGDAFEFAEIPGKSESYLLLRANS